MKEKKKPAYMMVYECGECGQTSGFSDLDDPRCYYCESTTSLTLISRQELTPEVMAARLKAVTDNMMKNLESAYQSMTDADKAPIADDEKDWEGEMLNL